MDVRLILDARAGRRRRLAAALARGIAVNVGRPPLFSTSPRGKQPRNTIERGGRPSSRDLNAGVEQA